MSDRKIARALNISRPVVAQYIKDFKASGLAVTSVPVKQKKTHGFTG
jgi:biotin operon repressor